MPNLDSKPPQIKPIQEPGPAADACRAELRHYLGEMAWSISVTCSTLQNYLELRQDFMVGFSVRQLIAYARALRTAAKMLETLRRVEDV